MRFLVFRRPERQAPYRLKRTVIMLTPFESFPQSEALLAGRPPTDSNLVTPPEEVDDPASLVQLELPEEIAETVRSLRPRERQRHTPVKGTSSYVSQLSWKRTEHVLYQLTTIGRLLNLGGTTYVSGDGGRRTLTMQNYDGASGSRRACVVLSALSSKGVRPHTGKAHHLSGKRTR